MKAWNTPQGCSDILSPDARKLELMRRDILDEFHHKNYYLTICPPIEFSVSLLGDRNSDLSFYTYQVTDKQSQNLIAIRSDITPQMARVDSSILKNNKINRLCYCDSIVRTSISDFNSRRDPLQIGAEYFGNPKIEADIEIIQLALSILKIAKIENIHIDIGHMGISRELTPQSQHNLTALNSAIHKKDGRLIKKLTDKKTNENLQKLINLYGDKNILEEAKHIFKNNANIQKYIKQLQIVHEQITDEKIKITYDLAEIIGFSYKTAIMFAVYTNNYGKEILRGGRYDNIGKVFGSSRPATGFSADLKTLYNVTTGE
jgi:ATP phosphoribosyltransferase regulatory subunit